MTKAKEKTKQTRYLDFFQHLCTLRGLVMSPKRFLSSYKENFPIFMCETCPELALLDFLELGVYLS